MSTLWIFSIEPIETRYTKQWHNHLPKLLSKETTLRVVQIDGIQNNTKTTPGAFLNFSDTNYWKSSQLCEFLTHYNNGETSSNDQFLFTDAWNPVIIQIKYMNDLLGHNWTLHGLWHAGSYDNHDALGQLIGNNPWVRHAEHSYFHCYDHNYFATMFHVDMFTENLLSNSFNTPLTVVKEKTSAWLENQKIVISGWPMDYLIDELSPYKNIKKENLILFPHRVAPEKQVDIFKDLEKHLPEYEFVVCQEKELTKHEYHTLLGKSKMIFSANTQETLGISTCAEGPILGALPLAPHRLSYTEILDEQFMYPSIWTENFDKYTAYSDDLIEVIKFMIDRYDTFLPTLEKQNSRVLRDFFSAEKLIKTINQTVENHA